MQIISMNSHHSSFPHCSKHHTACELYILTIPCSLQTVTIASAIENVENPPVEYQQMPDMISEYADYQ